MEKITVIVKIDEADAIEAGLDSYGSQEILIRPSELTPRQRRTLAGMCQRLRFLSENAQGHLRPTFAVHGLVEATQAQVQVLLDTMADEADEE